MRKSQLSNVPCSHPECSNTFNKRDVKDRTSYCSDQCRRDIRNYRKKQKSKAGRIANSKPCKFCGNKFEKLTNLQIFCKDGCKIKWHTAEKRAKVIRKKTKHLRNANAQKTCTWCHESFTAKNNKAKYCGAPCRSKDTYHKNKYLNEIADEDINPFFLIRGDTSMNTSNGSSHISGAA